MLKETMMQDMKTAMKEKNTLEKGVLSLMRSALISTEKEKGAELSTEEEITVVSRELKQTNDSLAEFKKAGREDLVEKELQKVKIIEKYLPEQMSKEEVLELIQSLNIDKSDNVGKTIGRVMPLVKGKADGKMVQEIIKEYMTGN